MLSVDGDALAAVTIRIHSGWFKFRSLAYFFTTKMVLCCHEERFMKHVYGVVCYTEHRHGH